MNLRAWEATIGQIADEFSHEPEEPGRIRVLKAWRVRLEKEPTSLLPYHIDLIVREVRKRLTVGS